MQEKVSLHTRQKSLFFLLHFPTWSTLDNYLLKLWFLQRNFEVKIWILCAKIQSLKVLEIRVTLKIGFLPTVHFLARQNGNARANYSSKSVDMTCHVLQIRSSCANSLALRNFFWIWVDGAKVRKYVVKTKGRNLIKHQGQLVHNSSFKKVSFYTILQGKTFKKLGSGNSKNL